MTSVSSTAAATSNTQATGALTNFANNFQDFLTLLTEQIKNQDPLSPMDSTQFTSQLVQFTGVEQGIQQNQNLSQLISLQSDVQMGTAVSYLGKGVDIDGQSMQLSGGTASMEYSVPTTPPVSKVTLTITDQSGNKVRTAAGITTAGTQAFNWDGKNDTGTLLPDGTYNVSVQGVDAQGNPVTISTAATGTVTDVGVTNGKVILTVGNQLIPLSSVTAVHNPPAASS
jgi:flagellar basal-body rod modification protein FlgD